METRSVLILILFSLTYGSSAQNPTTNSQQRIVDSSDLSWRHPELGDRTFYLKNENDFQLLSFKGSRPLRFELRNAIDSSLISTGNWGFNPGGWLVLTIDGMKSSNYSLRRFINFTFLVRDSEEDSLEKDFNEIVVGLPLIKTNGRIASISVITACRTLSEKYFLNED